MRKEDKGTVIGQLTETLKKLTTNQFKKTN